jgi:hypothetical protein
MLAARRLLARARPSVPCACARRQLSSSSTSLRLEPQLESIISRFQSSLKAGRAGAEKSKAIVDEFGQLQRIRVQKVLLVCSDYDSYTFEEDGLLSELVHQWYAEHSLSKPPTIDRVSSPELGIARFKEHGDYDMVIALSRMASSSTFIPDILRHAPATPIALLALTPSELTSSFKLVDDSMRLNVNKRLMWETIHSNGHGAAATAPDKLGQAASVGADAWIWPFMWQGSSSLFTAMFKAVEDRLNVKADAEYGVGTILIVEDSVKFYSSYLPLLYSELWQHAKMLQGETMHTRERVLRLHSRPKVLFCTNFEEAVDIFDRYRDNMFGVITDLGFPKGGVHSMSSGMNFVDHVKKYNPELPILLQTSQPENSDIVVATTELGAKYIHKSSPTLLQALRRFFKDDLLFGPMRFQDGVTGEPLGEVSSVTELLKTWAELPLTSVAYHARRQDLSRWFFGRAEFQLAKRFRASQYPDDFIDAAGKERPDWLRNWILSEVRAHRNKLASTVENTATADTTTPITRVGTGALGGKGRGFRFLHSLSDKISMSTVVPDIELVVPRCFILATSVFDEFMSDNDLVMPALNSKSDEEVERLFNEATLPDNTLAALRTYLADSTGPLAVRSSSLFEDAFMQPFAGIYTSKMLPNSPDASIDERLDHLAWAVKKVYASVFSQQAQCYAESMQNRTEEEKMAIILQPLVGDVDTSGKYFFPTMAGVANSLDFYPLPHTSSTNGCAQVALGLGTGVVDNTPAVHFSLADPTTLTGPDTSNLPVTALDLSAVPGNSDVLVQLDGAAGAALTMVPRVAGVAVAPEAAASVNLSMDVHGERVVFKKGYGDTVETDAAKGATEGEAAALQSVPLEQVLGGEIPVAKAVSFLLRLGEAGLGCPVEIEFALKARRSVHERHQLHLLQIRPQATFAQGANERFQFLPSDEYAAVASTRALGHGRFEGVKDVVYVSPERFEKSVTTDIANEIATINKRLQAEGRKYLLMAPGRWGSADQTAGIPVNWNDIDASAVIVETALDEHVPVSQGSHFFQNIISFGLGYMTVDPSSPKASEVADYAYWDAQEAVPTDTSYVRHVQLDAPLEIVVDGQSRHGVVMKPGKAFDVYVSQVDAFMALSQEQYGSNA